MCLIHGCCIVDFASSFPHLLPQVNELQSRVKELSPTESIFLSATMQFRETIKSMYSLQVGSVSFCPFSSTSLSFLINKRTFLLYLLTDYLLYYWLISVAVHIEITNCKSITKCLTNIQNFEGKDHSFCFPCTLSYLQKPQIAYKDLMKGYRNKVNTLADRTQKSEASLVVNLFQSVLDGFIRGKMKQAEYEPVKVILNILVLDQLLKHFKSINT